MIRINLLGRSKGQKGKRSFALPRIPNIGLLLALLVLVIEGAVAFQWSQQASEDANKAEARARQKKEEVEEYTKVKTELDEIKAKIEAASKEKVVFDELLAEKVGPANAMTYLCFILAPRKEAEVPGDELKQMELAGWRVAWPGERARAWLTAIREREGEVTVVGAAVDHADVAEVQRRLESSAYFRQMKLVSQERKVDTNLGVPYVEFSIRGALVYLIEPLKAPAAEGEGAEAAPADEADATGGDGKVAGDGSTESAETAGMLKSALTPAADAATTAPADGQVLETREEPDIGPQPVLPRPVEAPRPLPPPDRHAPPPLIVPAADPPAADQGADPNDPGASPAPSAPEPPAAPTYAPPPPAGENQ